MSKGFVTSLGPYRESQASMTEDQQRIAALENELTGTQSKLTRARGDLLHLHKLHDKFRMETIDAINQLAVRLGRVELITR